MRHVFFFNDTATTEIYTLSLHDALPISTMTISPFMKLLRSLTMKAANSASSAGLPMRPAAAQNLCISMRRRSEEHTSELQSRQYLVCRLLLEKKKNNTSTDIYMSPVIYQ